MKQYLKKKSQSIWEVVKKGTFPCILAILNFIIVLAIGINEGIARVWLSCIYGFIPSFVFYYIAYYGYEYNKKTETINTIACLLIIPYFIYMIVWSFIFSNL